MFQLYIVAAIGRVSAGDAATRDVVSQIVGQYGGVVQPGGNGSAADPIVAQFEDRNAAVEAAARLWREDAIENVMLKGVDDIGTPPASTLKESVRDRLLTPIEAMVRGLSVKEIADAVIEGAYSDHRLRRLVESCNVDPEEVPDIEAFASELTELAQHFSFLRNDTATMVIQELLAYADALRKVVESHKDDAQKLANVASEELAISKSSSGMSEHVGNSVDLSFIRTLDG